MDGRESQYIKTKAGVCLLRSFEYLNQSPALALAHRTSLHDPNGITDVAVVVLIVCDELFGLFHKLTVNRVLDTTLHLNGNSLVHFVAFHNPDSRLSKISFFHCFLSIWVDGRWPAVNLPLAVYLPPNK